MIKCRPILMNAHSVRAILTRKKTQTRRPLWQISPEWEINPSMEQVYTGILEQPFPWKCHFKKQHIGRFGVFVQWQSEVDDCETSFYPCPYGNDALWVREAWACIGAENVKPSEIKPGYTVHYRADPIEDTWRIEKWRPSIFMPRWANRITLGIVKVWPERVQDISHADIDAEGTPPKPGQMNYRNDYHQRLQDWEYLWDSINAKRGFPYCDNPWVWAIEFKELEVGE